MLHSKFYIAETIYEIYIVKVILKNNFYLIFKHIFYFIGLIKMFQLDVYIFKY